MSTFIKKVLQSFYNLNQKFYKVAEFQQEVYKVWDFESKF